jgi:8-O-methyltransferase
VIGEPAGPADLRAMVSVAAELDLFSLLAARPATLTELCDRLSLHPRPTEALLNGLCFLDVLALDGTRYRTGTRSGVRPDHTPPAYPGATWQGPLWTRLRTLLETGEPQGANAGLGFCADEVALRRFAEAADARSAGCGPALAGAVDWDDAADVVDLGGGRGTVLAGLLRAHPHLTATSFDLPVVRPLFDEHVARLGLASRMRFLGGDFFTGDLPAADVYVLGHLLFDWDDDRCAHLVEWAAAAVRPGGTLLLYDLLLDPDQPHTNENWLHSLHSQLIGPGGTPNTAADCREWFAAAGLTGVRVGPLAGTTSLVVGTRPGT